MNRIRVEQPFTLYAKCSVDYCGRAKSTLEIGNYLIIHKSDGTLLIQGGTLCTPRNYQPPKTILQRFGNQLISTHKKEKIAITIEKIHFYKELKNWSIKKINITKTERELQNKLAQDLLANQCKEITVKFKEIYTEFPTPVGPIDILGIDVNNVYHVIEVKRGKANLAACSQLERYANYFIEIMKDVKDYIASPEISSNATNYMKATHQTWIKVSHSI